MPESDILLSIDGDTTPLKGSLKNTLKWANKEAATFMKFGQMRDILGKFSGKGVSIARGPKLPTMPTPTSPFDHYKKTRGKMKGMDIEGFGKKDTWFKKLGTLWKINLFWKWIKGTWNAITRYVPLLKGLSDIFSSAIGLILTALLLPFLPEIVKVLTFILQASAGLLSWVSKNLGDIRDVLGKVGEIILIDAPKLAAALLNALGPITPILEKLIPETIKTAFKFLSEHLPTLTKGIKYLSGFITFLWEVIKKYLIKPITTILAPIFESFGAMLGDFGVTGALKGLFGTLLRMANIAMWISLIADILKLIVGAIFGKDNPLYKFLDIISELTDVVGFVIAAFQDVLALFGVGKGGNVWAKISGIGKMLGLANGGIVTSPTTALIGEAGPEAVIPLDKLGGMGSTSINVSGLVDEQKFRRIIQDEFNRMQGRLSRNRGAVSI